MIKRLENLYYIYQSDAHKNGDKRAGKDYLDKESFIYFMLLKCNKNYLRKVLRDGYVKSQELLQKYEELIFFSKDREEYDLLDDYNYLTLPQPIKEDIEQFRR